MPRPLDEAVRRQRERRERGERESRRSIGQDLAQVGVLGWTVVLTTLVGIFAGRWLDHRWGTGIAWTLGLLFAGIILGCVLAWKRLRQS